MWGFFPYSPKSVTKYCWGNAMEIRELSSIYSVVNNLEILNRQESILYTFGSVFIGTADILLFTSVFYFVR